jgi:hypothetical protein
MGRSVLGSLLAARARHAGARWLLVAVGVGLATVLPVLTAAVTRTTASAALHRGVAQLAAGDRTVTVSYTGLPDPAELSGLDAVATGQLRQLGSGSIRRQLLFNELADTHGRTFRLAGTDQLAGTVRLVDGRMPGSCTPTRCEVALLVGASRAASTAGALPTLDPALGLVPVGRVQRTDPLLLSGTFDPGVDAPVLLADGAVRLGALTALSAFGRAQGWVAPLDLDRVVRLGVDGWVGRAAQAGTVLSGAAAGMVLSTPEGVLRDQDARARVSAGRFGLLGGATAVVLLGSAVVGGAALRRDHEAFTGALRRRGASRRLLIALVAGESALATGSGVVLGLLVGGVSAAVLAARAGLPAGTLAAAAVGAALPWVLGLAVAAGLLLAAVLAVPAAAGGTGGGIWRALEAACGGCLAVAALLAARGGVGPGSAGGVGPGSAGGAGSGAGTGASGGAVDPLLPVLPVLVLLAAALLMARIWPGLTRAAVRVVPRRAVAARLGLAAAGGRPLRPASTAAVLTAAVAAAVFAGSYAATLDQGAADQAAFAVPLDLRLLPGPGAAPPLQAAPPQQLAAQLPGATVYPVVRTDGSIRRGAVVGDAVHLIGLDPAALAQVARWHAVTGGGADPRTVADRLTIPLPTGDVLPAGGLLRIPTSGDPVRIAVTAVVRAEDGREAAVPLAVAASSGAVAGRSTPALVGRLPDLRDAAGRPARLRLAAITVQLPTDEQARRLHALGEGSRDLAAPTGAFVLGTPAVDGAPLPAAWRGWSAAGASAGSVATPDVSASVSADATQLALRYRLTVAVGTLTGPPAAGTGKGAGTGAGTGEVPVAVDPATAADAAGGLNLLLDGLPFPARAVAVLDRFPTTTGRFAVLDRHALADLIDRTQAGAASPAELWLTRPGVVPGQARPDLGSVEVHDRIAAERALRSDPVARAAIGLLVAGAAFSLAAALVALVLLVAAERSDEAAASYAWEADGVAPGTLRAGLWWRAAAVAGPAVPLGVLAGVGLSGSAGRLVAITATATAPVPPLQPGTGAGWGLGAVLIGLLAALAVAGVVAGRSLREPLPVRRAGWSA